MVKFSNRLGEVNPYSPIVNEHILHLEIRLFRIFSFIELDEGILQRVASLFIPDDLTTHNLPETGEYELEIFVPSYRVELADEQDVLRGPNIREWQIANHLES